MIWTRWIIPIVNYAEIEIGVGLSLKSQGVLGIVIIAGNRVATRELQIGRVECEGTIITQGSEIDLILGVPIQAAEKYHGSDIK